MTLHNIHNLHICPMKDGDKHKIIKLWHASGLFKYDGLDAENEFTIAMLLPQSQIFLAYEGDDVIAVVLAALSHQSGWIWDLAVHPDIQRKGVGKAILRHAENWIKAQGGDRCMIFLQEEGPYLNYFYAAQSYSHVTENILHKSL